MKIRTNKLFDNLLPKIQFNFLKENLILPSELLRVINNFVQKEDCVFLAEFLTNPGARVPESDFDKCEVEENVNDVHIDNYVSIIDQEHEYLKFGLEVGKRLYHELTKTFAKKFRVIISYSPTVYENDEIEIFGGCVVKFHLIRPSCDKVFRLDNLEGFHSEAVVVLE